MLTRFGISSLIALFFVAVLGAAEFSVPRDWRGKETGTTKNNPVEVDDKPMWRFDQIWPADPFNAEAYKLMKWDGGQWKGEHEFGGQPSISIEGSKVILSARGGWSGGEREAGGKCPALVFIAPAEGKYTAQGTVTADIWHGEANVELLIIKKDAKTGKLRDMKSFELTKKDQKAGDLAQIKPMKLNAGDELIFVAHVPSMHTAATFNLKGLTILEGEPEAEKPKDEAPAKAAE